MRSQQAQRVRMAACAHMRVRLDVRLRHMRMRFHSNCACQQRAGTNLVRGLLRPHRPMDFQIREPLHPLLGAMPNTNVMMAAQA